MPVNERLERWSKVGRLSRAGLSVGANWCVEHMLLLPWCPPFCFHVLPSLLLFFFSFPAAATSSRAHPEAPLPRLPKPQLKKPTKPAPFNCLVCDQCSRSLGQSCSVIRNGCYQKSMFSGLSSISFCKPRLTYNTILQGKSNSGLPGGSHSS